MQINLKRMEKLYNKSIEILKRTQLTNGGCLATPPGERYPYVYPRDNAFSIMAFSSAGLFDNARMALEFNFKNQPRNGIFPQRFDKNGEDASYKPMQLDGTGLLLFALADYVKRSGDVNFLRKYWKKLLKSFQAIKNNFHQDRNLVFNINSVHEFPPMEKGYDIWTNAICFGALKEIGLIGKKLSNTSQLLKLSKKIKKGILDYMWNSRVKSFVRNIRIKEASSVVVDADISENTVEYFGVLPPKDKKCILTVKRIENALWNKDIGGICRYEKHWGRNNGGWGPWPNYTCMIATHYIRIGNRKKAEYLLNWVQKMSWKNLLAEHYATKKEFEEFVNDYKEAKIFRKDRLVLLKNIKKHPMFKKQGIAPSSIPLAWCHAEFILTWDRFKEKFLE